MPPLHWQSAIGAISRYLYDRLPWAPPGAAKRIAFRADVLNLMSKTSWERAKALHRLLGLETSHNVDLGGWSVCPMAGLLAPPRVAPSHPVKTAPASPLVGMPAVTAFESGVVVCARIEGEIAFGNTAGLLAKLKAAKGADIMIDSHGGDAPTALAIGERLARMISVATASGCCFSAALLVLQGAKHRKATADTLFLAHAPRQFISGTASDLRTAAAALEGDVQRALKLFGSRVPRRTAWRWLRGSDDFYFDAPTALKLHLIDEVIPAPRRALAPMAGNGQSNPDAALLDLAADLVNRLEGAAKDQAGFRAELARRLV